jgi:hypothetical protein
MTKTKHGRRRMQQRGYRNADIELVMQHGTDVDDGYMLTNQDVHRAVERLKRRIRKLERLKGTYVVLGESNELITTYRPDSYRTTRLLRA